MAAFKSLVYYVKKKNICTGCENYDHILKYIPKKEMSLEIDRSNLSKVLYC